MLLDQLIKPEFKREVFYYVNDIQGYKKVFSLEETLRSHFTNKKELSTKLILRDAIIHRFITETYHRLSKLSECEKDNLIVNALPFIYEWLRDFQLFERTMLNKQLSLCKSCFEPFYEIVPSDSLCRISNTGKTCRSLYWNKFINSHKNKIAKIEIKLKDIVDNLVADNINSDIKSAEILIAGFARLLSSRIHRHIELLSQDFQPYFPTLRIFYETTDGYLVHLTNIYYPPKDKNKSKKKLSVPPEVKQQADDIALGINMVPQNIPFPCFNPKNGTLKEYKGFEIKTLITSKLISIKEFLESKPELSKKDLITLLNKK